MNVGDVTRGIPRDRRLEGSVSYLKMEIVIWWVWKSNSARISPIDGKLRRKFAVVDSLTAGDDGGAEYTASGTHIHISYPTR